MLPGTHHERQLMQRRAPAGTRGAGYGPTPSSTGSSEAPLSPPQTSAAPLPSAAESPALAPKASQLVIPPANITVVRTAEELQRATISGAVDIEIRAHLDLRNLTLAERPTWDPKTGLFAPPPPFETGEQPITLKYASLYASHPLRSIRGNCSEPAAEALLGLPNGTFPDLLPLKPRQCLLIVEKTWLMVTGVAVWIDNLYLKLSRRQTQNRFKFITDDSNIVSEPARGEVRAYTDIYVTGTTFHGEHRGEAAGVVCNDLFSTLHVDGCIFTDWAGTMSPLYMHFWSVASVRNTVFRNMHLHVELADVSYEGMVNFQNVSLANVTLEHGAIVSTSLNDYQQAIGFYLNYYAEDDANYDMPPELVPLGHQGMFGEDFVISNSSISDCVYLLAAHPNDLYPGCPVRSAAARNQVIDRSVYDSFAPYSPDFIGSGMPAAAAYYYDYDYYDVPYSRDYAFGGVFGISDYGFINPRHRLEIVVGDKNTWLQQTQQALPPLAPAPDWPPFVPPPPLPRQRTSLLPDPVDPSPAVAAAMLGPLDLTAPPTDITAALPAQNHGHIDVMAILLIIATELLVAGAVVWVWASKGDRIERWLKRQWTWHRGQRHFQSKGSQSRADNAAAGDSHVWSRRNESGLNKTASDISRGADVPPASLLNSNYEYVLPSHLALFALPASLGNLSMDSQQPEPGDTVVVAPYTISLDACAGSTSSDRAGAGRPQGMIPHDIARTHPTAGPAAPPTQAAPHLEDDHLQRRRHTEPSLKGNGRAGIPQARPASAHCRHQLRPVREEDACEAEQVHDQRDSGALWKAGAVQSTTVTAAGGHAGKRLQRQLDRFSAADLFLGRFEMLGRHHRRRGGQAVVQFAQSRQERCEFAVKFFLDWDAFLTEAALYAAAFPGICRTGSPEVTARARAVSRLVSESGTAFMSRDVSKFLPQVEAVCDGAAGGLEDPRGRPLPPCIVMETGESLQDLCNRAEPDIFTVLAVLSNVSSRIAVMHALGYVHRDLKPANVMWLPRQNRWTVIDFGCVARVGEQAPLSFTLAYAPPEVIAACQGRRTSIDARPALDAWSLGVMAYELLTGAPAFDLVSTGRCKVMAMLAGDLPLPWEGELSTEVQRSLGVFKEPVLQLLQRNPANRISLDAFHSSCTRTRLFTTQTSQSNS